MTEKKMIEKNGILKNGIRETQNSASAVAITKRYDETLNNYHKMRERKVRPRSKIIMQVRLSRGRHALAFCFFFRSRTI